MQLTIYNVEIPNKITTKMIKYGIVILYKPFSVTKMDCANYVFEGGYWGLLYKSLLPHHSKSKAVKQN